MEESFTENHAANKLAREVHELAVGKVLGHEGDSRSRQTAKISVAAKIGYSGYALQESVDEVRQRK